MYLHALKYLLTIGFFQIVCYRTVLNVIVILDVAIYFYILLIYYLVVNK